MKRKLHPALLMAIVIAAYFLGMLNARQGYIKLEDCIPLEDISCYFIGKYDYPCFELKDYGYQLDDPMNRSYEDIMSELERRED